MTQSPVATQEFARPCSCGCGGSSCLSLSRSALKLSRTGIDFARSLISGEAYDPRRMALCMVRMGAAWAEVLGAVPGFTDRARWLEFSNKLTAYRLFVSADTFLPPTSGEGKHLPSILQNLSTVDAYSRLWSTEGLGWYCGKAAAQQHAGINGRIFDVPNGVSLEHRALVPLHTGAGLALAQAALGDPGTGDLRSRLGEFRKKCDEMCGEEYKEAAFEALGLVAITLYPELIRDIERELSESDAIAYFWHGAGRGTYFSPLTFVPLSATRRWIVETLLRAPGTEMGRHNALAGIAWATTLVNVRSPEVLECCLRDLGEVTSGEAAFANGVASALIVWQDASPDDPCWIQLKRYCPQSAGYRELWDRAIAMPAAQARRCYDAVRTRKMWGSIFRFQDLEKLQAAGDRR